MTEDEAIGWIGERFGEKALATLRTFAALVTSENARQNLVAPSTLPLIWSRHITDSAQLVPLASESWSRWLDIGTGGGFPGMVVAVLAPEKLVTMVEPRGRRVEFLNTCVAALTLRNAEVIAGRVEALAEPADVISARAVGSIATLTHAASRCAHENTTWLLPRGRSGRAEADEHAGVFHVEHSLTDPSSTILVARGRLA